MTQTPDGARHKYRQPGPNRNGSLRFHPIPRRQVRQLRDLRPKHQPEESVILNGDVERVGNPDRPRGDFAGLQDIFALVSGYAVLASSRTSLLQGNFRGWRLG